MGPTPFIAAPPMPAPSVEQAWLKLVRAQVEGALAELLELPDEARLGGRWTDVLALEREYVLRPSPRVRPAMLLAGYCLARGSATVPAGLWRFAAGLELLHAFYDIHDDAAAQAALRHGGLAMHHLLTPSRAGRDLAVVVGDHLFARALETMLGSGLPAAAPASQFYLRVFRHGTVGRFLDLGLGPLGQVSVFQALRVTRLEAVRQGLCAPLACGAMLAGAEAGLRLQLARLGDWVGLAWRLRAELLGLFEDFTHGRRTFPVVAAWTRARPEVRRELEELWALPPERKDDAAWERARRLMEEAGGRAATERLVARASHGAVRALAALPNPNGLRELLQALIAHQAQRMS